MKRISENTKVTLTLGQLKKLVRESLEDKENLPNLDKADSIKQFIRSKLVGFVDRVDGWVPAVRTKTCNYRFAITIKDKYDHDEAVARIESLLNDLMEDGDFHYTILPTEDDEPVNVNLYI